MNDSLIKHVTAKGQSAEEGKTSRMSDRFLSKARNEEITVHALPHFLPKTSVIVTGKCFEERHPLNGIDSTTFRERMERAGLGDPNKMFQLLQSEGAQIYSPDTVRKWYDHPDTMPDKHYRSLEKALERPENQQERAAAALAELQAMRCKAKSAADKESLHDPSVFAAHRREAMKDLLDCMDDQEIEYLSVQMLDYLASREEPYNRDETDETRYLKAATVLYLTSKHKGCLIKPSRNYLALSDCDYYDIDVRSS